MIFSDGGYQSILENTSKDFSCDGEQSDLPSWSNLNFLSCFCTRYRWLHRGYHLDVYPAPNNIQGVRRALLCNVGPPSLQSSSGIPSTPAAFPLLGCSRTLVISFIEGQFIQFCFEWLLGDTDNCWILSDEVSAKEGLEVLRPTTQNGGLVCKKHSPICTAQRTLDPMSRAIYEEFV